MVVEHINIEEALEKVGRLLKEEKDISPALRAAIEVVMLLVSILASRMGRNSRNSHKPPSQDPNRLRKAKTDGDDQKRKPGGQFQCNNPQKFQLNIPHVKVDSHVLIMRHGGLYVTQGGMDGDSEFKVAGDEYFRDFTIVWN